MLLQISATTVFKTVGKHNLTNLKIVTNRSLHSARLKRNRNPTMRFILECNQRSSLLRASSIRHASNGAEYPPSILEHIPDVPVPPVIETFKYHTNGELTFESMGLGGYSPVGLLQSALEYLHVGLDLPWWAVIMTGTAIVRIAVFPIILGSLKNTAKVQYHTPMIQKFQKQSQEAKQCGDAYEAALQMYQLQMYMKKHEVSMLKSTLPMLVQMPIFLSFFMALRRMVAVPVESLQTGGLWWFTDLTVADPYYVLPILSSITMFWIIHTGAEGVQMYQNKIVFTALRLMPLAIFPFTYNFPTAIFCYWMTTNIFSVGQGFLLKSTYFRKKVGLPENKKMINVAPPSESTGSFWEQAQNAWNSAKVMKQMNERNRVDERAFMQAGTNTPVKTYDRNPAIEDHKRLIKASVFAKKRDI